MQKNRTSLFSPRTKAPISAGFTLIEILIGVVVMSIVATGIFATFRTSRQSEMVQRQVANLQQQLRGSMYVMERDIRIAGYDPTNQREAQGILVGITDIQRYDISGAQDAAGKPALSLNYDMDSNKIMEQSMYLLYDIDGDGTTDLARTTDGGATFELVAEGIEDIGFAFAFDAGGSGAVNVSPNGNIIWAVDSDNDNRLDRNLDVNDDGIIDAADVTAANLALSSLVTLDEVRMVRIWLLARSIRPAEPGYIDRRSYLVGDHVVAAANDNFRRRTIDITVNCRNLGL